MSVSHLRFWTVRYPALYTLQTSKIIKKDQSTLVYKSINILVLLCNNA
jgi:hypothetical protein